MLVGSSLQRQFFLLLLKTTAFESSFGLTDSSPLEGKLHYCVFLSFFFQDQAIKLLT